MVRRSLLFLLVLLVLCPKVILGEGLQRGEELITKRGGVVSRRSS